MIKLPNPELLFDNQVRYSNEEEAKKLGKPNQKWFKLLEVEEEL